MNVTVRFGCGFEKAVQSGSCDSVSPTVPAVQSAVPGGSNPLVPKALRTAHFGALGEWPRGHAGEYTSREFGA